MSTLAKKTESAPKVRRKPTRAERGDQTRQALFAAAAAVVGEVGYRDASVARITERAGIAQGTFYNYFPSRQDLFDELLPRMGKTMLAFIRGRIDDDSGGAARERQRIDAYFDFLTEAPGFYRILYEAETLAPEAHRKHIDVVASGYARALKRSWERGEIPDFREDELEALAYMLLAIRGYLSLRYGRGSAGTGVPRGVLDTYEKLMRRGLFKDATAGNDD